MRKCRVTAPTRSDPVRLHHHLRGRLPARPAARALQQPRGDPPGRHQDGPTAAAPGATQGQGHRSGAGWGRGGQLTNLPETSALSLRGKRGPHPRRPPALPRVCLGWGLSPGPRKRRDWHASYCPPSRVEGPEPMGSWCKKAGLSEQEAGAGTWVTSAGLAGVDGVRDEARRWSTGRAVGERPGRKATIP